MALVAGECEFQNDFPNSFEKKVQTIKNTECDRREMEFSLLIFLFFLKVLKVQIRDDVVQEKSTPVADQCSAAPLAQEGQPLTPLLAIATPSTKHNDKKPLSVTQQELEFPDVVSGAKSGMLN